MIKKILICLIIFLSYKGFSQHDTITYNDVKIIVKNNKRKVYLKDKPYTGYIRQNLNNEKICYEFLREGITIKTKCINIFKDKLETKEIKINYSKFKENEAVNFKELKIKKNKSKEFDDDEDDIIITEIYFLNNKEYTGFAKNNDTLAFIFKGGLRMVKVFYSNGNINEIFEYKFFKKNGKYEKYNLDSKKIELGNYRNNLKSGTWEYFNKLGFDYIKENYRDGIKDGICFFYNNKNLMRCEFYKYGVLDYYYTAEFYKNKEVREFFRNNKKYAIVKYIDGHIDESIEIKK